MARVTCTQCGDLFQIRSQGPQAKFCSSSCRSKHYRSNKKQDTLIIESGESFMTQNTPMQFVFSETEFQQRCDNARGFYAGTIENPAARKQGAIVQLDYTNPVQAFEVWHEYRTKGYTPLILHHLCSL